MVLRLVNGGSAGSGEAGARGATAFLLVSGAGAVTSTLGWESLSAGQPPRRIGPGADEDSILNGIGRAVAEARKAGRPAVCSVEVSLERRHLYAITAAPLPGKGKEGVVAVVVQEAPPAEAGRTEGKVIRQLGHDLRTPLTSISGAVELLQSGRLGPVPGQQERVLGMMQKGVDAMVRLIDEATAPFRRNLAADLGLLGIDEEDGPPARRKRGRR